MFKMRPDDDCILKRSVMSKKKTKSFEQMEIVHPHAAGIDVGSRSHFVAIGQSPDHVQEFSCYTQACISYADGCDRKESQMLL
jgi:hypothetical protein